MFVRSIRNIGVAICVVCFLPPLHFVMAHPNEPFAPHDLWSAWNTDPVLWLLLIESALIYSIGVQRIWRRAGIGKGISIRQGISFIVAMLALIVALISPLDALSGALFSAHMLQHMILIIIVAPLLLFSGFVLAILWALPHHWSRAVGQGWNRLTLLRQLWQFISRSLVAWAFFGLVFWLWHLPLLYEAALHSEAIHAMEHVIFLLTAALFWYVLFDHSRSQRWRFGLAVPYLFTTTVHTSILGALIMFSSQAWYASYSNTTMIWGLSPLEDQQLSGLIMWVPSGGVFTLLTIFYFGAWFSAFGKQDEHNYP